MTLSRRSALRLAAAGALGVPLAACTSSGDTRDELQVVENPTAATAATSPAATVQPAGRVLPLRGEVRALAVDDASRTLAVAVADPPSIQLFSLENLDHVSAKPSTVVDLPAPAEKLTPSGGTLLVPLPGNGTLARIALPSGKVTEVSVPGQPAAAAVLGERTLVAARARKAVDILAGGKRAGTITGGLYSADDVLVTGGRALVLDRLRTALFRLDVDARTVEEGLRAGMGATNAVVDSFGRVLVADTRGGGLLAFSADPLLLRQRYPVPGGIFGIAYDSRRHLAWVTLTRRNEVVAFDVAGGEPKEMHRYPTVRQPNSVTVDERTFRVVVGSAAGEGIQVIAE